jgi:hypothetical protein
MISSSRGTCDCLVSRQEERCGQPRERTSGEEGEQPATANIRKNRGLVFIACIFECFTMLWEATSAIRLDEAWGIAESLTAYFEGREAFFSGNPECYKLFCSATSNPPAHLKESVKRARSELDSLSLQILTRLIRKEPLRPGIHIEDVAEEFRYYQDYFNLRARSLLPEEREKACRLSLDILLYGVIKRDNT